MKPFLSHNSSFSLLRRALMNANSAPTGRVLLDYILRQDRKTVDLPAHIDGCAMQVHPLDARDQVAASAAFLRQDSHSQLAGGHCAHSIT